MMKPTYRRASWLSAGLMLATVAIPLTVCCGPGEGGAGTLRTSNAELMFITRGYLEGNLETVG